MTSNLPLFRLLYYANMAHYTKYATQPLLSSMTPDLSTLQCIITHQRHPMPFIDVCLGSCFSPEWVVRSLLDAGKWATADSFVRERFAQGVHSPQCWTALCEGYMRKTGADDRWEAAADSPGPTWEAVIECARRSCQGASVCLLQWRRIYDYSFSVGGCELALDTAEEAAAHFLGYLQMQAIASEHRRAGRESCALRCDQARSAMVILPNMAHIGLYELGLDDDLFGLGDDDDDDEW